MPPVRKPGQPVRRCLLQQAFSFVVRVGHVVPEALHPDQPPLVVEHRVDVHVEPVALAIAGADREHERIHVAAGVPRLPILKRPRCVIGVNQLSQRHRAQFLNADSQQLQPGPIRRDESVVCT